VIRRGATVLLKNRLIISIMSISVTHHQDLSRFEIYSDDTLAGLLEYIAQGDVHAFTHTIIETRFEGHGLGGKLVGFALETARDKGWKVLPYCPFVHHYMVKNPEFIKLVPEDRLEEFKLSVKENA
jgi:predicted GNAT family acetyltransferase